LFGEDEVVSSSCLSRLVAFAEDQFPNCDSNFHRQFAFLSHAATVNFLSPLLVRRYGSLDDAKIPTLEWLEKVGSFETIARLTRDGKPTCSKPASLTRKGVPAWYQQYCKSDRFHEMKNRAQQFYQEFMGELHCSVNARHPFEVFHHSDYGRLGMGDEFRFLVPYCNDCHCSISARGPNVPASIPEGVKQWL
jgi:hypothetical protein